MNDRILELIKNPNTIQKNDLSLLELELKTNPYIQSIRALHLLATSEFLPENYKTELSKTAAYTTDKKILYHFINKLESANSESTTVVIEQKSDEQNNVSELSLSNDNQTITEEKIIDESEEVEISSQTNDIEKSNETELSLSDDNQTITEEKIIDESEEVEISSQTNEIEKSDETELNLSDENQTITEKKTINELEEVEENPETNEIEKSNETELSLSNENQIVKEEEKTDNSQLSFHNTDTFLPNVVSAVPPQKKENYTPPKTNNKHEEEMKRLIAEVEAKIKAKKEQQQKEQPIQEKKTVQEPEIHNSEISFSETQSFDIQENKIDNQEKTPEQKAWKPMSFSAQKSDAEIGLSASENLKTISQKEEETIAQQKSSEQERPVFNVSFFAQNVSKIDEEDEEKDETENNNITTNESNVPKFINTWQNWLKLDRKENTEEPSKEEIKVKAIEKFIENEPKISKLKEETEFVIKEKTNDISHLMTETLANLYATQKLYTKAIKAYEILIEKHPEKTEWFTEKIEKIKLQRLGK